MEKRVIIDMVQFFCKETKLTFVLNVFRSLLGLIWFKGLNRIAFLSSMIICILDRFPCLERDAV